MNTIRIFAVLTVLLGCELASAGTAFTVTVSAAKAKARASDPKAEDACTKSAVAAPDAKTDSLTVSVDAKLAFDVQLSVDGVGSVVPLAAGSTSASFPGAALARNRMLVMTAGKKLCEFILEPPAGTPTGDPDPTPPASAPVDQSKFASLDRQARQFLADTKHIQDHEIIRDSAFGRTFRIYHLPSGVPAFPLPRHVNEKDDVEIWIVVPFDGKANVEVTSCDKVPAYRVSGSYSAGKEALGRLESGERVQFGLEGYSRRLSCAGTLSYKIDLAFQGVTASTATSLPFDPVFRFEWGIGYLFDFTRPRRLSLGDRVADDGSSEKFISESNDYAGARPVLTLSVNVCGTNPSELTWCDRLLNPTVIIDPKDPTGTFGLGLMVRPFHGFAVLAGMTVAKSAELADGVEANVGDTWSIAGELPTKNVFNEDGIGFVLGAVVSTDVLADLFKKAE